MLYVNPHKATIFKELGANSHKGMSCVQILIRHLCINHRSSHVCEGLCVVCDRVFLSHKSLQEVKQNITKESPKLNFGWPNTLYYSNFPINWPCSWVPEMSEKGGSAFKVLASINNKSN